MRFSPLLRRAIIYCLGIIFFSASYFLTGPAAFAQVSLTSSPTDGTTPAGFAPGAPAGSYALSGFETINPYTGGLNFRLPLLQVGGRGGVSVPLMLQIEQKWSVDHNIFDPNTNSPFQFTFDIVHSYDANPNWWSSELKPEYSAGVMIGRAFGSYFRPRMTQCGQQPDTLFTDTLTRLTFIGADGTEFELRDAISGGEPKQITNPCTTVGFNRGRAFVTADGSGATFISDQDIFDDIEGGNTFHPTGYLFLKDGTRYRISAGRVTEIRDRNGNRTSYAYTFGSSLVITDSLNRTVTITYRSFGIPYDEITWNGSEGTPRYLRVYWANLSQTLRAGQTQKRWNELFPLLYTQPFTYPFFEASVPSQVLLPDGRSYYFKYNSYAELARVELPTGGVIEYDWGAGLSTASAGGVIQIQRSIGLTYPDGAPEYDIYRRVNERRLYVNSGALESRTVYGLPDITVSLTPVTVESFNAGGQTTEKTKHYYQGNPAGSGAIAPINYSVWNEGREVQTEQFAQNGSTILRRGDQTWQQRAPVGWYQSGTYQGGTVGAGPEPPNDPRLVTAVTSLVDTNQVSKQTWINPSDPNDVGYDQYNNPTKLWEFDYGAGSPGNLLRHTRTQYLTSGYDTVAGTPTNPNPAATIHIRNLPTSQAVYSDAGAFNKMAETTYEYDNYTTPDGYHAQLVTRSGISGLCDGSPQNCPNGPNFTDWNYKTRGNVTKVSRWLNAPSGTVNTYQQYDVAGNVVKVIDANNNSINFDFRDNFGSPDDSTVQSGGNPANNAPGWLGGQTSYAFPFKVTNAMGHIAYTKYDYYLGRPVLSQDPNNIKSSVYFEDTLDRPTKGIRAVGTSAASQTVFKYKDKDDPLNPDPLRSIITISDKDVFGESGSGNGIKSLALYDGLGRTWRSAIYEGNTGAGNTWAITDTQFDALGRVSQVSNPYRATDPASASAPSGTWTTTTYDALSRVTTVQTPDTAVVTTSFTGNAVTVTDQALKKRRSLTDALGRLIRVDEPDAGNNLGSISNPVQPTHYTYDTLDNLTTVAQGVQTRTFAYDSLNRLTSATNPESGGTTYQYDPNGNLMSKTDARPVTTTITYDALNRPKTKTYSCNTPAVSYVYDNQPFPSGAPGGFIRGFAVGRLVAVNYGSGSSAGSYYGYDELGRVVRKTQQINGNNYAVTNAVYNRASAMTSETYPSNRTVNYSYDIAGRLNTFSGALGDGVNRTYATVTQYSAAGLKERETYNGITVPLYLKLAYNKRHQLVDLRLSTINDPSNWNRGALTFYHGTNAINFWNPFWDDADNNGNVRRALHYAPLDDQISSHVIPQLQDYTYDELNRISSVSEQYNSNSGSSGAWFPSFSQTFAYDRYGNRRITGATGGVNSYNPSYNTENNRINGLTYDAVGNITNDPATGGTMIYDGENRMEMATSGGGGAYTYDGEGKRVKRMLAGGQEWWYVYGIGGELLAEYLSTAPATVKKEYGYRDEQLLVVWDADKSGDERLKWLVTDHLGSTRMEADKSGSLAGMKRHDYAPFGEAMYAGIRRNGSGQGQYGYEPPQSNVRVRFGSKERDGETGLDFFGARYFSSLQGRFTSPDPIPMTPERQIDPQRINLYQYSRNNPLAFSDPTGMELIRLGQHTDEDIDRIVKKIDDLVNGGNLPQDVVDVLTKRKTSLLLEKEGNKIVQEMLDKLDAVGERQGLRLTDFTLSTEAARDFRNVPNLRNSAEETFGAVLRGVSREIYILKESLLYRAILQGVGYYHTGGFTAGEVRRPDLVIQGATFLPHEKYHRDVGASERLAYREQRRVLDQFGPGAFMNQQFFRELRDFLSTRAGANQRQRGGQRRR